MSVTQKQKKSPFFPVFLLMCSTDSGQAMKEPLTCEEASQKSSAERRTYYQTAFAEAVRDLLPDYNGYQKVRPLLDGAMSQLVRGADAALSQNIHTLFDTIYGRWARLLVDRLWQIVENTLGAESAKPENYSPARRTEIVNAFATHITLPQNLSNQKTALFQTQQWGGWPSWLARGQTNTAGIGFCWNVFFVELLDLALKLHTIELPVIERNHHVMTEALKQMEANPDAELIPMPVEPTVGLMNQINGQVTDMVVCRGGCSSGSFWRLLYVMAGTFQEKLDALEEEIQLAKAIVSSSLLDPPLPALLPSTHSSSTSSSSSSTPSSCNNLPPSPLREEGGVSDSFIEGSENPMKREEQSSETSSSLPPSTTSSSFLRSLPPPPPPAPAPAPAPGKPPPWNPANRALSLQQLNEWQKRKDAYDTYQEWLKTDER